MSSLLSGIGSMLSGGAATGTGIVPLLGRAKDFLKVDNVHAIPELIIVSAKDTLQAQFGSYPDSADVAPSAVFTAVFLLLMCGHLYVWYMDRTRGHHFPLSLAFAFYCLVRFLGWVLRIVWAKDLLKMRVGLASEVFLIISNVLLSSMNLILAQRVYTWKHPIGGTGTAFSIVMYIIYAAVLAVIIMSIVAGVVPYLYFLSQSHYDMCRNVMKVSSLLIALYSLLAIALTWVAFIVPTHDEEKNSLILQPFWIKSFGTFYYPSAGDAKNGQQTFLQAHRGDSREPIETILGGGLSTIDNNTSLSELQELGDYENQGNKKFSVKRNHTVLIIALTSLFVFIGSIFRCVGCFLDRTYANQGWLFKPVVMYCLWGALEAIVNVIYLVFRIDLRFYRPDSVKAVSSSFADDSAKIESDDTRDSHDLEARDVIESPVESTVDAIAATDAVETPGKTNQL